MGESKRRKEQGEPPKTAQRRFRRRVIGATIAVVAVVGLGTLYYVLTTPGMAPVDDLPTADADAGPFPEELDRYGVSIGPEDAPVVVREFADYQCQGCARLAPIMKRFRERYVEAGQVRFVYFDFPLPQHDNAEPAAIAARCAGEQDAYWPMHSRLYEDQSGWADAADPTDRFVDYAEDLDLNSRQFRHCLSRDRHADRVQSSFEAGEQVQVRRTPTLFVDNIRLTSPGWYQLSGVVERELPAKSGE